MRTLVAVSMALALANAAAPQSVISVRAGIVNAAEGAVFINGQPVAKKFGTFPSLHEGSDLYTQDGRAELQLGPNVFLRVGMNSAVRMVSSNLSDTQLRILNGSAIFDSGNAPSPGSVTLLATDATILVEAPTRMRVDADPPQLRVEKGAARVTRNGAETVVQADQVLPLTGDSVVKRMTGGNDDALEFWSLERNREIFLSLSTSQSLLDPGTDVGPAAGTEDLSAWLGYMPLSGVLPVSGIYSTQPLGYTYAYPYAYGYSYGYGYPYGYAYAPVYTRAYLPGIYTARPPAYTGSYLSVRPVYTSPPSSLYRPSLPSAPRPIITARPAAPHVGIHK